MRSVKDWLGEGEALYGALVQEFQNIQQQMSDMEQLIAEKKLEVDQLAQLIGRPGMDRNRRASEFSDPTNRVADALRPQPDVAVRML